jgi:protein-disulfide isomerase
MLRRTVLLASVSLLCLAQDADWKKVDALPGVDFSGISKGQQAAVLAVVRSEPCACGCQMKVAECRVKDPACGVSRRLASFAIRDAAAGKNEAAIRADLDKYAKEPPAMLDPPVKLSTAGAPFKGPADAKVTIVEFSDFQCPYCAKAAGEAALLVEKYPKEVKLVFKQFPLEDHSQAELAAEASLAAQAQGKFWPLHDKMYANFRQINRARILVWAQEVGLDMTRFRAELDAGKYKARVHAEEQEGEVAGVEGTPTFYINGQKFNGVFEVKAISGIVTDELKKDELKK